MKHRFKRILFVLIFIIMLTGIAGFTMTGRNIRLPEIRSGLKNKNKTENISDITTFGAVSTTKGMSDAELEEDINNLVNRYYDAKQRVDMDALGLYVSHISRMDENELKTEAQYVEKYENIRCYSLNTNIKGAYRVYVYCDTKIYDVKKPVPSLNALYLKPDQSGRLRVYLGALTAEENDDINKLDSLAIVKKLQTDVQKNMEKVIKENKDAQKFYKNIVDKTNENEKNSESDEKEKNDEDPVKSSPASSSAVPGTVTPGTAAPGADENNGGDAAEYASSEKNVKTEKEAEKAGKKKLEKTGKELKNSGKKLEKTEKEPKSYKEKLKRIRKKLKSSKKKLKKAQKKKKKLKKKLKKYKKKNKKAKIKKYKKKKNNIKTKIKKIKTRIDKLRSEKEKVKKKR